MSIFSATIEAVKMDEIAQLLENPIKVQNRLNEVFGVPKELFLESIDKGVAGIRECTIDHPLSSRGTRCWADTTAHLRTSLRKLGWKNDNAENIPSIFNEERKIKIAVCNTTSDTGLEGGHPQPKIIRRANGISRAAFPNRAKQTEFENFLMPSESVARLEASGGTFWYLCVYYDFIDGKEIIRAEILCPIINKNRTFKSLIERIALNDDRGYKGGITEKIGSPVSGSDFEINVTRKQA